jgi:hypothetical protein
MIDFRTQKFFLHTIAVFAIWFSLFKIVRKICCACGINDTACITKNRISSRIRIYFRKGLSPVIRRPGRMFWWKNQGSKISSHCPFKEHYFPNNLTVNVQLLDKWLQYLVFGTVLHWSSWPGMVIKQLVAPSLPWMETKLPVVSSLHRLVTE